MTDRNLPLPENSTEPKHPQTSIPFARVIKVIELPDGLKPRPMSINQVRNRSNSASSCTDQQLVFAVDRHLLEDLPVKCRSAPHQLLLASLSFHAFLVIVMLLVIESQPRGLGAVGAGITEEFSVTWNPALGKPRASTMDTTLPEGNERESTGAEVTIEVPPVAQGKPLLSITQIDPQSVFNEDSTHSTVSQLRPGATVTHDNAVLQDIDSALDERSNRPANSFAPGIGNGDGTAQVESSGGSVVPAGGGTSFFGILTRGKRIVYVIDASESMRQHQAMHVARRELWSSLQNLTSTTQFQIIFFNLHNHAIPTTGERTRLMTATSANLRLAKQFLHSIQPDSGTDRFSAINQALSFMPDVIFLLTDADDPILSAKELWDIKQRNKSRAVVHVVEFGMNADLSHQNFLKQLTLQNRGTHVYHDLTKTDLNSE